MKICEDCIKKEVCKFKDEVERYEVKANLPEPLMPTIMCKYKQTTPPYWYSCVSIPSVWTTATADVGNDIILTCTS